MADAFTLPAGFGFARLGVASLRVRAHLFDTLQIFEHPRSRGPRKYVIGADVSDGIGKDRSVAAVHRMGTIEEPEEQVALFVSNTVTPSGFAYVLDALGRLYTDEDKMAALLAIEVNNHGLSTQDTLQLHLAYPGPYYVWEYLDAGKAADRYSKKIGWVTTQRTRPMLLDKLYHSLTTVDPTTGQTDLLVHAQILIDELADFVTETTLAEAAAQLKSHDDTVMATAIAHYVAWRMQGGEQEPLDSRRARHQAEKAARLAAAGPDAPKRDWRNTGCTLEEQQAGVEEDGGDMEVYDGERGVPIFLG
jgi:hypothetical protein